MGSIDEILADPQPLIAAMSALAAFAAVIAVALPYLQKDELADRLARVEDERERIRVRERKRLAAEKREGELRLGEPRRIFRAIVEQFNLSGTTEDGDIARRLRRAGFRGQSAAVTYVAVRVIAAAVMGALGLLYLFVILPLDQPAYVKAGAAAMVGGLGWFAPAIYVKNRVSKRQTDIKRSWPDALDLMLICIESGMTIEAAFRRVAEEIGMQSPALAEELSLTTAELSYLQDRRSAYEGLGDRTDLEGVRAVVTSLIQAEKYGTPLARSIRVLAQENRDMRMAEAEKKAAALPPKLTVPMILFFLPVLFAVIITPAAIQIMSQ